MPVKKTQKRKLTGKNQKGSGITSAPKKTYRNLRYRNSSFVQPELICPVKGCGGKVFKYKGMKIATPLKSVFIPDHFYNKFFAFTCVNCGYVQMYSSNLKYDDRKV